MPGTTIYAMHDPTNASNRVYVGKTVRSLDERYRGHVTDSRRGASFRSKWIKSILARGTKPEMVVLEIVPDGGDWAASEKFWISSFRGMGLAMANATDGGEGTQGFKCSEATIAKRRIPCRKETREKISLAHMGKRVSDSHRESISKTLNLRTHCKRGHAFTDRRNANGKRQCWTCQAVRERNYENKRRVN